MWSCGKHDHSAKHVPVSACIGSSKNLQHLKEGLIARPSGRVIFFPLPPGVVMGCQSLYAKGSWLRINIHRLSRWFANLTRWVRSLLGSAPGLVGNTIAAEYMLLLSEPKIQPNNTHNVIRISIKAYMYIHTQSCIHTLILRTKPDRFGGGPWSLGNFCLVLELTCSTNKIKPPP